MKEKPVNFFIERIRNRNPETSSGVDVVYDESGNKLWRARSRYDEFFVVRPRMRVVRQLAEFQLFYWLIHVKIVHLFVIKTDEIGISPAFLSC